MSEEKRTVQDVTSDYRQICFELGNSILAAVRGVVIGTRLDEEYNQLFKAGEVKNEDKEVKKD